MNDVVLHKYHGLGNDFLVYLDEGETVGPSGPVAARRLCDRHRGIGADGLVHARRLSGSAALLSFRLWNADGSEAEMSGNGMRCLAHAALERGWVDADEPFSVDTAVGPRRVEVRRRPPGAWARVAMGMAELRGEQDRCNVGHGQLRVDMGNPHLVVLGADPGGVDVAVLGPRLEATEPGGLNVEFVTLGPGPDTLTMRVWERGVGETQACGTGSCAAAVALHHWGRVGTVVTVHQPGGALAVDLHDDGTVSLSGSSERIATCHVDPGILDERGAP